ncbi:MAG: hypothetical protein NC489_14395 [Ruminococcus flavefaciens]|nr:hypothetical protein [Ruminococcus flavefaciens]
MRMTNKIMQNNSLYNINNNKLLQDKLSTQMSTQKKITRPSDDPVIAIRALRLRTNVSELTQFYGKNAPDADSWLTVSGKALGTVADVLTDMSREANKASNKEKTVEDLQIILEQLKSLKNEFYSTGNMDYAGRYVFTGYRTTTPLSFTDEVEEQGKGYPSYDITEQIKIDAFDTINYTNVGKLDGLNKNNCKTRDEVVENDVSNKDIHRLRLAYDKLAAQVPKRDADGKPIQQKDGNGDPVVDAEGNPVYEMKDAPPKIEIMGADGQTVSKSYTAEIKHLSDNPYNSVGEESIIFVPETGEILIGDKKYAELEAELEKAYPNNATKTEIRVSYTKDEWQNGDLRPEHYFACTGRTLDKDGNEKSVTYNQDYLTEGYKKQVIEYDVGYNQKIQINTTADEVFTHSLDRDMDDLERALDDLDKINTTREDLKKVLDEMKERNVSENDATYIKVKNQYDAAGKAYDYIRENVHKMFEKTISDTQGYLDDANVAITDNGTRSQRLDLISNRLMDQKTTFQTLQSENEDADIAEVAIQLTSTELTYNAALMATGKIMQTSLMNYI